MINKKLFYFFSNYIMNLLDLNDHHFFTNNVQNNLKIITQKYGNKFIIKDYDVLLPSYLYIVKEPFNEYVNFYSLVYDIEERETWLFPFKINFFDYSKLEPNNNCYIANIQKTDKVSGTDLVITLLKFLKIINIKTIKLHDGAHIICGDKHIDLSLFKLIEKGIMFYEKFGFKLGLEYNPQIRAEFGTDENFNNVLSYFLSKFNNIKIDYYVYAYQKILEMITQVIENQDYDKIKIYLFHPYKIWIRKDISREYLQNIIMEIDKFLSLFLNNKKKFLRDAIVEIFYNNCIDYVFIEDFFFNYLFMGIAYNKKKIILKHNEIFQYLKRIRNSALFTLDLN